jgi:hypothetical protein
MDLRARGNCRAILGMFGLVATAVTSGCGGGGKGATQYPDGSVTFDTRADTTVPTPDAGGTQQPPVVGPGSQALVVGDALLVGNGPDSCTSQDPATGDRWCAFAQPSNFLGGTDLWVINVSKAVGGKAIQCNASDLDCLLLTSTLNATDLTIHHFFGDTLIYYADSGATGGPVYGWRPGMTAARKLTGAGGLQCVGHSTTDAVLCFDNQDTTTDPTQLSADLLAGKISVGGTATLPKVATMLIALQTDPANLREYQVGLSAAGDWVAWSARPTATGVETLNAQKLNDDSTRVVVAEDVSRWTFSRDGARWYWLKRFNYNTIGNPLGTLQMASFPTDTGGVAPAATTLRANVASFGTAGDKGLVYFGALTNGLGELGLIADRDQPTQVKVVDSRALRVLDISQDGRTAIYAKTVATDGSSFDLYAGGLDLATPCALTPTAISPPPYATLSDPSSTVFWSYGDALTGELVGEYTTVGTCQTKKFSTDLWFWTPVKDQGVVYADTVAGTSFADLTVTLRYAQFTGTALPTTGTVVQERANQIFATLLPALPAVVYTINTGGATDGLYVKAGLPFATTP